MNFSGDDDLLRCSQPDCPGYYPEVGSFLPGCGCKPPPPAELFELAEEHPLDGVIDVDVPYGEVSDIVRRLPMAIPREEVAKLIAGLLDVEALIDDSRGVAGLHLNGDDAPWGELRSGGRYGEWLVRFDDALNAVLDLLGKP